MARTRVHTGPSAVGFEDSLRTAGYTLVAGADEVGRGCLAGPVVAAAVILPAADPPPGLDDSKRLSPARRRQLYGLIRSRAVAWAAAAIAAPEIDRLNIHQASLLAMRRAVLSLAVRPDYLLIDGRHRVDLDFPQEAVVGGDGLVPSVAAASIMAKVLRDRLMALSHVRYPVYNFAANKGYGTAEHQTALVAHGPCPLHRMSYAPVAQCGLPFGS